MNGGFEAYNYYDFKHCVGQSEHTKQNNLKLKNKISLVDFKIKILVTTIFLQNPYFRNFSQCFVFQNVAFITGQLFYTFFSAFSQQVRQNRLIPNTHNTGRVFICNNWSKKIKITNSILAS